MSSCRNCHTRIFEQHSQSMHASSFTNPVFQAQYYDLFLARLHEAPAEFKFEPDCLSCHAPIAYLRQRYLASRQGSGVMVASDDCSACHEGSVQEVNVSHEGVACDFCHRIQGYKGDTPGNGNYIASPGQPKLGPLKTSSDWHHAYHELQTKSEFCAICHSSRNRFGLQIRTTYDEWRNSRFAKQGIECQDCHMNAKGFLTEGKAVYETGKAAVMTLGSAPERDRLYTHRFFGAHSASQIKGALKLEINVLWPQIRTGVNVPVAVRVFNDKTGHKMPSGSAELRVVYLDVVAKTGMGTFPLKYGGELNPYGMSGTQASGLEVYGDQIPPGRRLYHAVFTDKAGRRTFSLFEAARLVYDNRLQAGEVRSETFYMKIPDGVSGDVAIEAALYYVRYPAVFSQQLGVPVFKPIEFAADAKRIVIVD